MYARDDPTAVAAAVAAVDFLNAPFAQKNISARRDGAERRPLDEHVAGVRVKHRTEPREQIGRAQALERGLIRVCRVRAFSLGFRIRRPRRLIRLLQHRLELVRHGVCLFERVE